MNRDWMQRAVEQICWDAKLVVFGITPEAQAAQRTIFNNVRAAIEKECPFQKDVAYMPVPRCDSCAHWMKPILPVIYGECRKLSYQEFPQPCSTDEDNCFQTIADFGCVEWEART